MRRSPIGAWIILPALVLAHIVGGVAAANPQPFTEEASQRGVSWNIAPTTTYGHGALFADLDRDGDPDLVLIGGPGGTVGVFENDGSGQFTNLGSATTIRSCPLASGIVAGDYDGDGDLDLFITNHQAPDMMLRNDGGFVFTEVPALVGLADTSSPGTGCAWGDYDDDGWLDLFIGVRTTTDGSTTENSLMRNMGDGTLADVSSSLGLVGDGVTHQGVLMDYDRDGDVDLYVSNDKCGTTTITNRLWRNDAGSFTDVTQTSGATVCFDSMGVAAADFDGNLAPDLYATNLPYGNKLLTNQGDGTFSDSTDAAAVGSYAFGWGALFADFDNDGHRELFICNMDYFNRLYSHGGSWPASDVASAFGVAGPPNDVSHGAAVADIDLDGDLDLVVTNTPGTVRLYVNHEGELRHWVRFAVAGRRQNTFAIGAEVEITAGPRTQLAQQIAGSNYKSQNELILHFGLDDRTVVDEVRVVWPGGTPTRVLTNLAADRVWTLYPPERLGDADGDGDRRLDDFVVFAACVDELAAAAPGCEMMDFDGNGLVTATEIDAFLAVYDDTPADCNANGHPDMREIVEGTLADVDTNGVPDACESGGIAAGRLDPAGSLGLGRAGATVELTWGAACGAGGDFAVYGGAIGDFDARLPLSCSTGGGSSWSVDVGAPHGYFIVVPRSADREGSYGLDGSGAERLPAPGSCLPQAIASCP